MSRDYCVNIRYTGKGIAGLTRPIVGSACLTRLVRQSYGRILIEFDPDSQRSQQPCSRRRFANLAVVWKGWGRWRYSSPALTDVFRK